MISMYSIINLLKKYAISSVLVAGVLFGLTQGAYAIEYNAATMIQNLTKSIPDLMRLVTALAYVFGIFFVIKSILELKHVGESRTMMSQDRGLKGPLIYFFVGAFLLWLPGTVHMGTSTFFNYQNPLVYVSQDSNPWDDLVRDAFMIIELVGTIALIRGLVMLTQLAHHGGGQQGGFAKGMTHVVGGILCINMYAFAKAMINTFGLGDT